MTVEPRLHLDADFAKDAVLTLDKEQAHYLITVMRRKAGDGVRVFNGRDGEWRAEIVEAGRRNATLLIAKQLREQSFPPDLVLYFAPVKKARTDFIVEKATELGARSVTPVITARTIADRVKTERLALIAREAAEQTERLDLPEIGAPVSLTALIKGWDVSRQLIFCDEAGEDGDTPWGGQTGRAGSIQDQLAAATAKTWAILIGPEGGFAPEERALLRSQTYVLPVTLGPRILRADTAVVAAMSVWQALRGDWR